jgi:hypothetical protein
MAHLLAEAEDRPAVADIKTQLVSLWMAPIFGVVLLVGFFAFPGFTPPMSPEMSADQVASFYRDNAAMVRFSMITFNLCGVMLLPFFMVIVVQMKRMTNQTHVFAYCYLTAAVSGATLFALSAIFFLVAAFRPGRGAELVQLLNDLGWMILIAPVGAESVAGGSNSLRRWDSAAPLDRTVLGAHRLGHGTGRRRRDLLVRPLGLERCHLVLAAQHRADGVRRGDVLRAAQGHCAASGPRGTGHR